MSEQVRRKSAALSPLSSATVSSSVVQRTTRRASARTKVIRKQEPRRSAQQDDERSHDADRDGTALFFGFFSGSGGSVLSASLST